MTRKRWPATVFEVGDEPDPRFSLANERTFLAWVRTSLGLTSAGVALDALGTGLAEGPRTAIALVLVVLGMVAGAFAFVRWAMNEVALRRDAPLPGFGMGVVIVLGMLVVGGIVLVETLG